MIKQIIFPKKTTSGLRKPSRNNVGLSFDANGDLVMQDYAGTVTKIAQKGRKIYKAILTQASTGAPTAVVVENTLSGAIAWTRTGAGEYTGTLSGAFPEHKTFLLIANRIATSQISVAWGSANTILVKSFIVNGTLTDALLDDTSILIETTV